MHKQGQELSAFRHSGSGSPEEPNSRQVGLLFVFSDYKRALQIVYDQGSAHLQLPYLLQRMLKSCRSKEKHGIR